MQPPVLRLTPRQLLAIVFAQVLALTTQAWLSRNLLAGGYAQLQAHYFAYLVVPPILLLLLAPVLLEHRQFLRRLFSPGGVTLRMAIAAIVIGVATRVVWWAQLIARVSFGMTVNDDPEAVIGPVFSFACPPLSALLLGLLVMAVLVPVVEETVHRGLVQSAFVHTGAPPAILISALFFTVLHPPSSYGFVFLMGVLVGTQFWLTGSLWATIITHATYNAFAQLDWRCLQGHWNPAPESLPQLVPGGIALLTLATTCFLILVLLNYQKAGAQTAPAPAANETRPRRAP
jgi:membrane protease YdiL (CAAX protease family)